MNLTKSIIIAAVFTTLSATTIHAATLASDDTGSNDTSQSSPLFLGSPVRGDIVTGALDSSQGDTGDAFYFSFDPHNFNTIIITNLSIDQGALTTTIFNLVTGDFVAETNDSAGHYDFTGLDGLRQYQVEFSAPSASALIDPRLEYEIRFDTVPEPATIILLGIGITSMGYARRRRKNRA